MTLQPKAAVSTSASAAELPKVSESEEPSTDAAARAATHLQSDMDSRNAACYFPMAQRAMVLHSKVTIRTAGGEYEASAPRTLQPDPMYPAVLIVLQHCSDVSSDADSLVWMQLCIMYLQQRHAASRDTLHESLSEDAVQSAMHLLGYMIG